MAWKSRNLDKIYSMFMLQCAAWTAKLLFFSWDTFQNIFMFRQDNFLVRNWIEMNNLMKVNFWENEIIIYFRIPLAWHLLSLGFMHIWFGDLKYWLIHLLQVNTSSMYEFLMCVCVCVYNRFLCVCVCLCPSVLSKKFPFCC